MAANEVSVQSITNEPLYLTDFKGKDIFPKQMSTIWHAFFDAISGRLYTDAGTAKLSAGVASVSSDRVTATCIVLVAIQEPSGTFGALAVAGKTPGQGFTIRSSSGADESNVAWIIFEP